MKKPHKKQKDRAPFIRFFAKVMTAKCKKPPPKEEVVWFGT